MKDVGVLSLVVATMVWNTGCIGDEPEPGEAIAEERQSGVEMDELVANVDVQPEVLFGCAIYKDPNCTGDSMVMEFPNDYNDLHRIDGFGDVVSSVSNCEGVVVFNNSNFTGSSYLVPNGSCINLSSPVVNEVSSARWVSAFGPGTCGFFVDDSYTGASLTVVPGLDYNDLHRTSPSFGDSISSVWCSGNTKWPIVCKNDTWGGACKHLSGNDPDLHPDGYGDNVSSITWSP